MILIAGQEKTLAGGITRIVGDLVKAVEKDLQGIRTMTDLAARVKELREQNEKLEIEKGRKEEEFARKEREVEHKIGLERKRQEFEVGAAKREATLAVREENLAADRKRFEEQMVFVEKRFTEQVDYLKEMVGTLAKRLPSLSMTAELGGK